MALRIGDTVFDRHGRPGVVIAKDPETDEVKVQRQGGEEFEKIRRVGFINGLSSEEREQFHEIMSETRQVQDPKERVQQLMARIDELKEDPRNHTITRYIEGELAHILNTERINPREFTVDSDSIRF